MNRIGSPNGLFIDGDPFNGVAGTVLTADWLNDIQEELLAVIVAAGIVPDGAQRTQILAAITKLMATATTQNAGDKSTKVATDEFVFKAIAGIAIINVAGAANRALTADESGCGIIVVSGVLAAKITLTVPAGGQWRMMNGTNFDITVKAATGSGVALPSGVAYHLFYDGANVRAVEAPNASAAGLSLFFSGS